MRPKRVLITAGLILAIFLAGLSGLSCFLGGPPSYTPELIGKRSPHPVELPSEPAGERLRIMTLNLSHGRGARLFRLMVSENRARQNLDAAASLIRQASPHVVALQEADESAFISGGFNHVRHLARTADIPQAVLGRHILGPQLVYGTAVMSTLPIQRPLSQTFAPSPPTLPKGFTAITVPWPGGSFSEVSIVSVHLDFLRSATRKRQVELLAEVLLRYSGPLIVAGDLNSTWQERNSAVRHLAKRLSLKAWDPELEQPSFPAAGSRIDWILISSHLAFSSYQVLPEAVSDHLAVTAEVRPADSQPSHNIPAASRNTPKEMDR